MAGQVTGDCYLRVWPQGCPRSRRQTGLVKQYGAWGLAGTEMDGVNRMGHPWTRLFLSRRRRTLRAQLSSLIPPLLKMHSIHLFAQKMRAQMRSRRCLRRQWRAFLQHTMPPYHLPPLPGAGLCPVRFLRQKGPKSTPRRSACGRCSWNVGKQSSRRRLRRLQRRYVQARCHFSWAEVAVLHFTARDES